MKATLKFNCDTVSIDSKSFIFLLTRCFYMLLNLFLKDDVLCGVGCFLEPADAWKFMMLCTGTRNQRQNEILWAKLCARDYGNNISAIAVGVENGSDDESSSGAENDFDDISRNDKATTCIKNEALYFNCYQEPGSLFQLLLHVASRLKPGIHVTSLLMGDESVFHTIKSLMSSSHVRIPHTPSIQSDSDIIHVVLSGTGGEANSWFKSLSSDIFSSNRFNPCFHGWSGLLRLRFCLLNVLDEKYYVMLYSKRTNRIIVFFGADKNSEWWQINSKGLLTFLAGFDNLKASINQPNSRHMEIELHYLAFNWMIGIDYDRKFYANKFRKYWPRGRGI